MHSCAFQPHAPCLQRHATSSTDKGHSLDHIAWCGRGDSGRRRAAVAEQRRRSRARPRMHADHDCRSKIEFAKGGAHCSVGAARRDRSPLPGKGRRSTPRSRAPPAIQKSSTVKRCRRWSSDGSKVGGVLAVRLIILTDAVSLARSRDQDSASRLTVAGAAWRCNGEIAARLDLPGYVEPTHRTPTYNWPATLIMRLSNCPRRLNPQPSIKRRFDQPRPPRGAFHL